MSVTPAAANSATDARASGRSRGPFMNVTGARRPDARMTPPPRSVALLGPDVILLAMETLAAGRAASSNAVLTVQLDGALDAARVRRALERFLPTCPWLGGRLVRPWPWGKLVWRVPPGGPTLPEARKTLESILARRRQAP